MGSSAYVPAPGGASFALGRVSVLRRARRQSLCQGAWPSGLFQPVRPWSLARKANCRHLLESRRVGRTSVFALGSSLLTLPCPWHLRVAFVCPAFCWDARRLICLRGSSPAAWFCKLPRPSVEFHFLRAVRRCRRVWNASREQGGGIRRRSFPQVVFSGVPCRARGDIFAFSRNAAVNYNTP